MVAKIATSMVKMLCLLLKQMLEKLSKKCQLLNCIDKLVKKSDWIYKHCNKKIAQ